MRERQAKIVPRPGQSIDLHDVQDRIATLVLEAVTCVAPARVSDTVRGWLARVDLSSLPPAMEAALMAEALAMATIVTVFTPTAGGTTAIDRLARRSPPDTPAAATAQTALSRTRFRLLQIEDIEAAGIVRLRDLTSGETIQVDDETMQVAFTELKIAAWLAPLQDGRQVFVGAVTPLDEAGVEVAMGFVRPGRSGLINPLRCADAVYRHVLRHGTPRIPGLNEPLPGEDDELAEPGDALDQLALQWAEPDHQRRPDDVQFVRAETSLECIVSMLASAANTRKQGLRGLSEAYASMAQLQMEVLQRRAAVGSGLLRLEAVATAIEQGIAAGELSSATRDIFVAMRQRLGAEPGNRPGAGGTAELDKLIGRIQALRAKTVEQGCTEQEAMAAAA